MSVSAELQTMVAARLGEAGRLRVPVPIVSRRKRDLTQEIEESWAMGAGLCAMVMPVLPTSIVDDSPGVFVDRGEVRVRLLEQTGVNVSGVTAWHLADDVATALQWHRAGSLRHPLQLAPRTIETVSDKQTRIVDVRFFATYALPRRVAASVWSAADLDALQALSASEALQVAILKELTAGLVSAGVPVLALKDHDQESEIANSGDPIKVQVQPARPARAMQGVPFAFFESWDVRVKVSEEPALNTSGVDVYDLVEEVMAALHWQPFEGFLAHPLQLAAAPTSLSDDRDKRECDVIFNATLGFQTPES